MVQKPIHCRSMCTRSNCQKDNRSLLHSRLKTAIREWCKNANFHLHCSGRYIALIHLFRLFLNSREHCYTLQRTNSFQRIHQALKKDRPLTVDHKLIELKKLMNLTKLYTLFVFSVSLRNIRLRRLFRKARILTRVKTIK